MKVIGRYSLHRDSLSGVIPDNSLLVLDIASAVIKTYDGGSLSDASKCSICVTTSNGAYRFDIGYASWSRYLTRQLAEELVEMVAATNFLDLRTYEDVVFSAGARMITVIDTWDEFTPLNVVITSHDE